LAVGIVSGVFIGWVGVAGLGSAIPLPAFVILPAVGWFVGSGFDTRREKNRLQQEVNALRAERDRRAT
jgi:hypothetical protein